MPARCSSGWHGPRVLRGGKGQLTGQVAWLGSPLALTIPTLSGNVAMDASKQASSSKAEPGVPRGCWSVLSLQALPRG